MKPLSPEAQLLFFFLFGVLASLLGTTIEDHGIIRNAEPWRRFGFIVQIAGAAVAIIAIAGVMVRVADQIF